MMNGTRRRAIWTIGLVAAVAGCSAERTSTPPRADRQRNCGAGRDATETTPPRTVAALPLHAGPFDHRTGDVSLDLADPLGAVASMRDAAIDLDWDPPSRERVAARLAAPAVVEPAVTARAGRLILSDLKVSTVLGIVFDRFKDVGLRAWCVDGHIRVGDAEAQVPAVGVDLRAYPVDDLSLDHRRWRETFGRRHGMAPPSAAPENEAPGGTSFAALVAEIVQATPPKWDNRQTAIAAGGAAVVVADTHDRHAWVARLLNAARAAAAGARPDRLPAVDDLMCRVCVDGLQPAPGATGPGVPRGLNAAAPAKNFDGARLDVVLDELAAATGMNVHALGADPGQRLAVDLRNRTGRQAVEAIAAAARGSADDSREMTWRAYDGLVCLVPRAHVGWSFAVEIFDLGPATEAQFKSGDPSGFRTLERVLRALTDDRRNGLYGMTGIRWELNMIGHLLVVQQNQAQLDAIRQSLRDMARK
jgi:hypothetical protein